MKDCFNQALHRLLLALTTYFRCKSMKKFEKVNNFMIYHTDKGYYIVENYYTLF